MEEKQQDTQPAQVIQPAQDAQPAQEVQSPEIIQEPVQQFNSNDTSQTPQEVPEATLFEWTAHEFIEHKKSFGWYALLILGVLIISAATFFVVESIFAIVMVVLLGIVFAVVGARKPKEITYDLSNKGIFIGKRVTDYTDFKSFSVIDEGEFGSIVFNPFKRFAFPTTIYYSLKDEEIIVQILSDALPLEEPTKDPIENLMRKIRF